MASPETLAALELSRALDVVATHAVSDVAAARVAARQPIDDIGAVRDELAAVQELANLLRRDDAFRPEPVQDVRELFDALEPAGAVLDGPALALIGRTLTSTRVVGEALDRLREDAPRLAALRGDLPPRSVEARLNATLDDDGEIPDGAHRDVDRARARVRDTRARLLDVLERTLRGLAPHEAAGDAHITLRQGRYVIPVARDARGRVPGIVHDESASGATLFIEPQRAVGLGNRLRAAEAEEARVVRGILRDLTALVREHLPAVRAGWEMCVLVDERYARARYAVDSDGYAPELVEAPGAIALRRARHPLLLAEGVDAVPFDLILDTDDRGVVVSGPNAGGKTVFLKAVGLLSALVQAGIVPPLGENSRLPVFSRLVADIGDHQSIEANLSTFTGHVATLRQALDESGPGTLVLLDEVGSGTDPREGAALAGAVVTALVEAGTRTIVTTHLMALKELAAQTRGIINASLEFDGERLAPTYRLLMGVPGRSYGLVIARRAGLPETVLEAAEARLPETERSLDQLVAEVERRLADAKALEADLANRRARVERDEADLAQRLAALERHERELATREQTLEREGRAQARRFLLDARRRVEEALGVARAAVSEATAKEARRLVEEGISREGAELRRLEDALREKGWKVRGAPTAPEPTAVSSPPPTRSRTPDDIAAVAETAATEIDLRGMLADEAREEVARAIDAAVVAELPALRVIHGKGTGRLRAVVSEMARTDRRVKRHILAPPHQGGTGVTILEFSS